MATIHAYFKFPGNTEKALRFYQQVFGGEFLAVLRFKDNPDLAEKLSEQDKEKILFMVLTIDHGTTLMASDVLQATGHSLTSGNNYYAYVGTDTHEEGERVFNKLSEDGEVETPFQKTDWGACFGSLKDKYGIPWMINYQEALGPLKKSRSDEMKTGISSSQVRALEIASKPT